MENMDGSVETFGISAAQAEEYEAAFVPALFAQWAPILLDLARVQPGQRLLDVACGTGILARTAVERVGASGTVVGVDLNEAMLAVARRVSPDLEWSQGDVAELPFEDGAFDVVLCQSAFMFFPDPAAALSEMRRVCAAGGTVGAQVYSALDDQPAYGPWVELVTQVAGPDARSLLGTYWAQGDADALGGRFEAAGLDVTGTRTALGTARFPSIDAMVTTEVESTPLVGRLDPTAYERIREASRTLLAEYEDGDGARVPIEALFVVGSRLH